MAVSYLRSRVSVLDHQLSSYYFRDSHISAQIYITLYTSIGDFQQNADGTFDFNGLSDLLQSFFGVINKHKNGGFF